MQFNMSFYLEFTGHLLRFFFFLSTNGIMLHLYKNILFVNIENIFEFVTCVVYKNWISQAVDINATLVEHV